MRSAARSSAAKRLGTMLGVLALAAALLGGCGGPILPFDATAPGSMLVPPEEAGVADGRARFREILCAVDAAHGQRLPDYRPCDRILWRLQDEPPPDHRPVVLGPPRVPLHFLAVPGYGAECFAHIVRPFEDSFAYLRSLGWKADVLPASGLGGTADTAIQIQSVVSAMHLAPDERLVFIGYSKGAADLMEALVRFPDLAARTAAFVTIAGSVNGSPLAGITPGIAPLLGSLIPGVRCKPGDGQGLAALDRSRRIAWLASHRLPSGPRYFSLVTFEDRAHVSRLLQIGYDRLAEIDPRNDGNMIHSDEILPGATLLGYAQADHWAVAIPFLRAYPRLASAVTDQNAFPREVLLEALARYLEEALSQDAPVVATAGGSRGAAASRQ